MKMFNRLSKNGGCTRSALSVLLLVALLLLFPGFSRSQTNMVDAKSFLKPWVGAWTFNDDASSTVLSDPNQKTTVEIKPTSDGKGLEITRKVSTQPNVIEWLVPDGIKRSVNASNCTGWQTSGLIAEAGMIISSSEMNCKDAGQFSTTNLKMIVAADKMVDILLLKAGGQTKLATRRLLLERDWVPAGSSEAYANTGERMAAASAWKVDMIIQLSKTIETQLLEAALLEKKVKLDLNPRALKDLKKSNMPPAVIDLLVALAYPDKFRVEKNGRVELKPGMVASSSSSVRNSYSSTALPGITSYYQGLFYDCGYSYPYAGYNPYGYGRLFSPGSCWSFYSPFWYDYPIYISRGSQVLPIPSSGSGGGYVQIEPQTTVHHAKPREENSSRRIPSSGQSGVYYPPASSGGAASSSSGGSSSAPASTTAPAANSGGSSGGGASPAGYGTGTPTGHTAVPR